tara:strand:+ start:222 stop:335 length:114 start_codon:yes stop_codon:yes gene_type:complete
MNEEYDKEEDKGRTGIIILGTILLLIILNGIFGWIKI